MVAYEEFIDLHPLPSDFKADVIKGLSQDQKCISPMYLYDQKGSQIFDAITELPEYYQTRAEMAILKSRLGDLQDLLPDEFDLVEYGSGSSEKTRLLLNQLKGLKTYFPIDISKTYLQRVADDLARTYPDIAIVPICADYMSGEAIQKALQTYTRPRLLFFSGSTIGNLNPQEQQVLLHQSKALIGESGLFLIGMDLSTKDPAIIQRAYDDDQNVTAEFNKNLLRRMNRELRADFNLDQFEHEAIYNHHQDRIEMHLVSQDVQTVAMGDKTFHFEIGETIHTENSYKFDLDHLTTRLEQLEYGMISQWTDPKDYFALVLIKNNTNHNH